MEEDQKFKKGNLFNKFKVYEILIFWYNSRRRAKQKLENREDSPGKSSPRKRARKRQE